MTIPNFKNTAFKDTTMPDGTKYTGRGQLSTWSDKSLLFMNYKRGVGAQISFV